MEFAEKHPVALPILLKSKLLVQAQSGGGKSYALRRIIEQTALAVQQFIVDPEGEFFPLREKFDFVYVATIGGDVRADPKTAGMLGKRLLEMGVSAIFDLSDMNMTDRRLFVKNLLNGLLSLPRAKWRHLLLVLDEGQMFCPQSRIVESSEAVKDYAVRARKRGLGLIVGIQRLAEFDNNVAAECQNKLIGRTGLGVDVTRAAEELGMTKKEAIPILRDLEPGQFFGFGPAISPAIVRINIGPVQTKHPEPSEQIMLMPAAPSAKVLEQLSKLADIEKDAIQEARTIEELNAVVADLRRQLAAAARSEKKGGITEQEVQRRIGVQLEQWKVNYDKLAEQYAAADQAIGEIYIRCHQYGDTLTNVKSEKRAPHFHTGQSERAVTVGETDNSTGNPVVSPGAPQEQKKDTARELAATTAPLTKDKSLVLGSADIAAVTKPQQRILDAIAALEEFGVYEPSKSMIAAHARVSPKSSGYTNNLGSLRGMGLVHYPRPGCVALTDDGQRLANYPARAPTLVELHESWLSVIPAPQAKILRALIDIYPEAIAKETLAENINVSPKSSGYTNNLGALRGMALADYPSAKYVRATDLLFPGGARL